MTPPKISQSQLVRLRRKAKELCRAQGIPLHTAQQQLSSALGYQNWSLLARRVEAASEPFGQRHYLHGDVEEGSGGRIFCARCDQFVFETHFGADLHADQRDVPFLAQSLGRWMASRARHPYRRRPDDAPNRFTDAIAVGLRNGSGAEAPFFRWLRMQTLRIDDVGEFAIDAIGDEDFSRRAQTVDDMRAHIASFAFSYKPSAYSACAKAANEFCLLTRLPLV